MQQYSSVSSRSLMSSALRPRDDSAEPIVCMAPFSLNFFKISRNVGGGLWISRPFSKQEIKHSRSLSKSLSVLSLSRFGPTFL
jgi:hypothetical protein